MAGESQQEPGSQADPSVLTTEQLMREVDRVKELMQSELSGLEKLFGERFVGIDRQLALVEQQRVEQKQDTKAAVDAALTAQKEAVKEQTTASERAIAKSEAATTKSIEQLGTTFTTAFEGQRRDIDDLKERVGDNEGQRTGRASQHQQSQTWQIWVAGAAVSFVIALIIIVANIATG